MKKSILVLGGFLFFCFLLTPMAQGQTQTAQKVMPNVIGMHLEQAKAALTKGGITIWDDRGFQPTADKTKDQIVFNTIPQAGKPVSGTVVLYWWRYESPAVPNVVGMKLAEALAAIQAAGFKPPVFSPAVPNPPSPIYLKVVSQNPLAGQKLPVGTLVNVAYKPMAVMPNFVGMDYNNVIPLLNGMKFSAQGTQLKQPATKDPNLRNKVFSQDPPAGRELELTIVSGTYKYPSLFIFGVYTYAK